jgi:hypothetical protein
MKNGIIDLRDTYRHVFLVQNRDFWKACPFPYDKESDLVLTFDFALAKEVRAQGGTAAYLDHLVAPDTIERHNIETYHFFENWYRDKENNDIFSYRGIDIGNALRLDIWNDVTYYVRIALNLLEIKKLSYEWLYLGLEDSSALDAIDRLGMEHETWIFPGTVRKPEYYFPMFRWMRERIRPSMGIKQRLKALLSLLLDCILPLGERLRLHGTSKIDVFVERYFPTQKIIEQLKQDASVNVVLEYYTWSKGISRERRLPVRKPTARYKELAEELLLCFSRDRVLHWEASGFCVSSALYDIIAKKIEQPLALSLHIVDTIIEYFKHRNLKLMVYIANLGLLNCLLLDYCKKKSIPSYLILNGLLLHAYPEEDIKGITWINSYGESIKKDYFKNADNIVCLGDPRLDVYINDHSLRVINYSEPTILIGTGAFSPIDLNSYAAVEFEFIHDVMQACRIIKDQGKRFKIIIKVRSNGYITQYINFTKEYFEDLPVEIFDAIPFSQVLVRADFYISSYSGTHFEAACLGIPTLYYKNDTEMLIAPYDGKSELVTAFSIVDMVKKIEMFYNRNPIYDAFRQKEVLEKYVGPLDGNNHARNTEFIYSLYMDDALSIKE